MRERVLSLSLIVVAGILTYLCAGLAGFLSIDDVGMVNSLATQSFTIKSLFFAGANEYYRPLVVVSYTINAFLGGLTPGPFHAVNVALHISNSLLVYWLATVLLAEREDGEWAALIAALFFLLTPLNSEAVTWISARPDLLCTFFFLLALILLVKNRAAASLSTLCCVAVAYLASLCCKEASIVLFGVAPMYLLIRARRGELKHATLLSLAVFASTALYLFLRTGPRLAVDKGVGTVVQGVLSRGAAHPSLLDGIGAYGFYLKKLAFPFPLNFTIVDYEKPVAFLALLLALPTGFYLLRRYQAALLPLLIVFLGIVPPVLAYLGNIAWTPLGERYLYLPMVGFSLLVSLVLADLRKLPRIMPVACLLLISTVTMSRVALWCDATAFWNDALRQSPGFAKSHSALGAVALEEQRYDDAQQAINRAISLGFNQPVVWQNLARVHAARKDYENYESAMAQAASYSPYPTGIYQEMIATLTGAKVGGERTVMYGKAIKYHLLALSRDPSYLEAYYNVGKLYLATGDLLNAERYLRLYTENSRNGLFRPFALKLIEKITAPGHG